MRLIATKEQIKENEGKQPIVMVFHDGLRYIITPDDLLIKVNSFIEGTYVTTFVADVAFELLKSFIGYPVIELFTKLGDDIVSRSPLLRLEVVSPDTLLFDANHISVLDEYLVEEKRDSI